MPTTSDLLEDALELLVKVEKAVDEVSQTIAMTRVLLAASQIEDEEELRTFCQHLEHVDHQTTETPWTSRSSNPNLTSKP